VGVDPQTITNVARVYAQRGGDVVATIARKKRLTPPVEPKVTGEVEARLIAFGMFDPAARSCPLVAAAVGKAGPVAEDIPNMDHSTIGRC